jgi:hypothetical protein
MKNATSGNAFKKYRTSADGQTVAEGGSTCLRHPLHFFHAAHSVRHCWALRLLLDVQLLPLLPLRQNAAQPPPLLLLQVCLRADLLPASPPVALTPILLPAGIRGWGFEDQPTH